MAIAPINYGGPVEADESGVGAARQALAQHQQVFADAHQLGQVIEGGSQAIAQGILHTQSLKATAAVKERQANTLQFIDSNPYVPKTVLQQRMGDSDYNAWHAKLGPEYSDKLSVPMFMVAGDLFDSEARQARQDASKIIALPGWREAWNASESTESSTIRERYVNRLAADQMIADQRGQALLAIDKTADNAMSPGDIGLAIKATETNPWLKPAERRVKMEQLGARMDSFQADNFIKAADLQGMEGELMKLRADNAADLYPHSTERQRLDLATRLQREVSFNGAKTVANNVIVGPNVDERGKVNSVAIAETLAKYKGPDKPAVEAAVKAQEQEALRIWDAKTSDVQSKVYTAGQDPATGTFSMARARQNPAIRDLTAQLNQDAPGKLGSLAAIDTRRQKAEDQADRQAAAEEAKQQTKVSHANLEQIRVWIDDEANAPAINEMTTAQWDSKLHDVLGGLTNGPHGDLEQARKDFLAAKRRGGKPDERPGQAVASELKQAAQGDRDKLTQITARYEDGLKQVAHAYLRQHSTDDPGKLTDGMRGAIREELSRGAVLGAGKLNAIVPGGTDRGGVTRYDWERNPDYAGHDFRLPDGTILKGTKAGGQGMVKLTNKEGQSMMFLPENVEAAKADKTAGWK